MVSLMVGSSCLQASVLDSFSDYMLDAGICATQSNQKIN